MPGLVADEAIHFTGAFVLAGIEEELNEESTTTLTGGAYGVTGYSEKHGVYADGIGEIGTKVGPLGAAVGGEAGIAYNQEKGTHRFAEPLGFFTVGKHFGVGIAWEPHPDLKQSGYGLLPPPLTQDRGEYSPFIFGEYRGVTLGLGMDISFRKAGK